MAEAKKSISVTSDLALLEIRGARIKQDMYGNVCLNDLWRVGGELSMKTPARWHGLPTSKRLISHFLANIEKFDISGKKAAETAFYSKKGQSGGTFAHPILALAYSEYLSEDLALEVKKTFLRVRAGDMTLIEEISAHAEEARKWQGTRDASKLARERFTSVLYGHDCDGSDIGYVTNAIYVVLLGGKAAQVKKAMDLPASANLRDNLQLKELVQTGDRTSNKNGVRSVKSL